MSRATDQVLTVAQMRAVEAALVGAGTSVDELMQRAGRGAADWVRRIATGRAVTVLCGTGNNGGDGYVIAQALHERGASVRVIAAGPPKTAAAKTARALFAGEVVSRGVATHGEVLVDCLFGSGLSRPLDEADAALLRRLAQTHPQRIAIDLPSGIGADTGALLGEDLPDWTLTLALGAWKPAHFLMPGAAMMGALRLVGIGIAKVEGAASMLAAPILSPPAFDAHKYTRGLLGVVAGAMPGAALLACRAAQHAGAGYVKLFGNSDQAPMDLVVDGSSQAIADTRIGALLIGPGLGRTDDGGVKLQAALHAGRPVVLDADALHLLGRTMTLPATTVATPHEGELAALEKAFDLPGTGAKPVRARALAAASGMVIVAKGPDTVIAAPDGRLTFAPRASSWLSVAGTGDVLAGCIASRLATGAAPFAAAGEGVWLHAEAARLSGAAFTAGELAAAVREAYAAAL